MLQKSIWWLVGNWTSLCSFWSSRMEKTFHTFSLCLSHTHAHKHVPLREKYLQGYFHPWMHERTKHRKAINKRSIRNHHAYWCWPCRAGKASPAQLGWQTALNVCWWLRVWREPAAPPATFGFWRLRKLILHVACRMHLLYSHCLEFFASCVH